MVKQGTVLAIAALVVAATIGIVYGCKEKFKNDKTEHFTAPGLTLTKPPPWWFPKRYLTQDWLVNTYPDQIAKPECMTFSRGDPGLLNFNHSAMRFFRF